MITKEDIIEALKQDELTIPELERFCFTAFKMNENPLPILRSYLTRNKFQTLVVYKEIVTPISVDVILKAVKSPKLALMIIVLKDEGVPLDVTVTFSQQAIN